MSATIRPETILRELSDLWVSLGKESDPQQASGVLRACAMTLITAVEESKDPSDVWSVMAALMPEHPSRAVVIRFQPSAERALSARVFSQCWMPFGQRRQICCEQIEITASDASLPDLPAVILPLAVSDLPVILWCHSPRLLALSEFSQLANIAQKIVLDSAGFSDPAAILLRLNDERPHQALADLAWTRLTRWRELISQIFENRSYLAQLSRVRKIRVGFGGAATPTAAYYMVAWLLDSLESVGTQALVNWESVPDVLDGELSQVELTAPDGEGLHVSIAITGEPDRQCAEVHVNLLVNRTVFPPDNDYTLLRQELSIPGRDPVFERTLARAAQLTTATKP